MIQQISLFNGYHKVVIILIALVTTLILAYCYAEFILALINATAIKTSPDGLVPAE